MGGRIEKAKITRFGPIRVLSHLLLAQFIISLIKMEFQWTMLGMADLHSGSFTPFQGLDISYGGCFIAGPLHSLIYID